MHPRTPEDQRHVRVQIRGLTVHGDGDVRDAPDGIRLECHDQLHAGVGRYLVAPAPHYRIGAVGRQIGGGGPPPPPPPPAPPGGPPRAGPRAADFPAPGPAAGPQPAPPPPPPDDPGAPR